MTKPTVPVDRDDRLAEETFLGRWSRRKLKRQDESGEPAFRSPNPQEPAVTAAPAPVRPPAEAPTDADMPPLETLDEHSDFSGFLSPRVSGELRKLALRKLFHLPKYQTRCILNEYEGNFNDFRPLGGVVTHEMRRMMELEAQRRLAEAVSEAEDEAGAAAAPDQPESVPEPDPAPESSAREAQT